MANSKNLEYNESYVAGNEQNRCPSTQATKIGFGCLKGEKNMFFERRKGMNFDKLQQKVEFSLAVYIYEDELPEEFFDGLTFEQWFTIHQRLQDFPVTSDELKKIALNRMSGLANNFDQWWKIYEHADEWQEDDRYASFKNELRKTALDRMLELMPSFEQWLEIYQSTSSYFENRWAWIAFDKMFELANSFDRWQQVYYGACGVDAVSKLKRAALKKMSELAVSSDQQQEVCRISSYLERDEEIRRLP